jgi:hypothetical protein
MRRSNIFQFLGEALVERGGSSEEGTIVPADGSVKKRLIAKDCD